MSTGLRARAKRRKTLIQIFIGLFAIFLVWLVIDNAKTNLDALGITSGFSFLERTTGWGYSFSFIPKSIDDTYTRTLFIGFLNTLFVGFISIILSTLFGFFIGSVRDSSNSSLRLIASVYVQIFRNIPLILQVVCWYSVLIHMPGPREAMSFYEMAFLSNRGLYVPLLNMGTGNAIAVALLSIGLVAVMLKLRTGLLRGLLLWSVTTAALLWVATILGVPAGEPMVLYPELKGLRFRGGIGMPLELMAMILAIVLYGSAYIAEVVRGGLDEVPPGLIEAGRALGLNNSTIWSQIKLPMALRTIIPPLGNQWIFIMKATTIGVAIGFSDFFMLISTSITQSGQTLELIGILMGGFLLVNYSIAQFTNWLNARLKLKAH